MRQVFSFVHQMGPRWIARRAAYSLRRRTGWITRRFPLIDWMRYRLPHIAPDLAPDRLMTCLEEAGERFFASTKNSEQRKIRLQEILPEESISEIIRETKAARAGVFRFFSHKEIDAGWPPRWHQHAESNTKWPKTHWNNLPDMGEQDVKWLWETGRFTVAYTLARAYLLTGDDAHAETFWQLVESFREENPPNAGAHWMCGQECAFRSLAWCFALFNLLDAPATTIERARMLVEMLAAHAERIEGNIDFAILQKNNHAINEALGLWTIGVMFPFLRSSARWEEKGRDILEGEAARQIYDDGAYIQHSMNYHRLILQSYSWAILLGRMNGREFSSALRERLSLAARFLYQTTDESGRAPNYGSNDGATLFRLDSCEFSDYRPALALAFWASEKRRIYRQGPWDEPIVWMSGEEIFKRIDPPARIDLAAETGGYYTIRSTETWAMIRCCRYLDRPAQSDMLSVDLWWRGANLLADPGTYSYNSAPPWNNGLSLTGAHNTVEIDCLDQMERGPRFTWFHWNRGTVIHCASNDKIKFFEGQQDGYRKKLGVIHRRAVMLVDEKLWIIIDDLRGEGERHLSSQWLFPKSTLESRLANSFELRSPAGDFTASFFTFADGSIAQELETVCGSTSSTRGWFSDRYFHREPALAVIASDHCTLPARRMTLVLLSQDAIIESVEATAIKVLTGASRFSAQISAFPYSDETSMMLSTKFESV